MYVVSFSEGMIHEPILSDLHMENTNLDFFVILNRPTTWKPGLDNCIPAHKVFAVPIYIFSHMKMCPHC